MIDPISSERSPAMVLLVAIYSARYPAVDEAHSIAVLGGCLEYALGDRLESLTVVDMTALEGDKSRELLHVVEDCRPNVIGISISYGTYEYLREIYPSIKRVLREREHLVVIGGATATYLSETVLRELDQSAVIVQGEGDEAIVQIVDRWLSGAEIHGVPNTCYLNGGQLICQPRQLVNLSRVPPPYRKHITSIASKGGQVFVEGSRGCSWAACTFCLRGLTDVQGHGIEHRRFRFDRLAQDLRTLCNSGVRAITFADEDFLGGPIDGAAQFVSDLLQFLHDEHLQLSFDVSMTVHSIYKATWSETEIALRQSLLNQLKTAGLRKVFLGAESGSPSQLRRYGKGQKPNETARASRLLREMGVELEIGFIMFDPLCTLREIDENIRFLLDNDLTPVTSALASELRVQLGERYLILLQMAEQRQGIQLYDRALDTNTLGYNSKYADTRVSSLLSTVRDWNLRMRPLHYPLKNLSRYGEGGVLQHLREPVRSCLHGIRRVYLERLAEAVQSVREQDDVLDSVKQSFDRDLDIFASRVVEIFHDAPQSITGDLVVSALIQAATERGWHE